MFGISLATTLMRNGYAVLGIDSDSRVVRRYADDLTRTVVADGTDAEAMRQLGVPDTERAVVAIGTQLESSVLATALLVDLGVPEVWAKALSPEQARILHRIGAHHVVLPEREMGMRVAGEMSEVEPVANFT